jgi:hypothetical protein
VSYQSSDFVKVWRERPTCACPECCEMFPPGPWPDQCYVYPNGGVRLSSQDLEFAHIGERAEVLVDEARHRLALRCPPDHFRGQEIAGLEWQRSGLVFLPAWFKQIGIEPRRVVGMIDSICCDGLIELWLDQAVSEGIGDAS